ncbi:hypothetical protein ACWDLL_01215 [Streptomyces griseoincarnatus]|uniref:hypothetical protein n=1 Tax=unclassified Streptomyces TaxID=2593676 RepID=UPI000C884F66|nr:MULTISPECIES: hypothetical protein [unclassified Streptomyces]MBJ6647380.1 hypothetical protein [Streptomyces sp. BSE7-9]MCA2204474.1 hypothetical protein [Streptomyces sp. SMS_SU21]NEA91601.1 hypothetical protein [Actinospica acidiphila]PWE11695.1 hypothetical protein DD630_04125 [Streptomyces sp. BSE7F]
MNLARHIALIDELCFRPFPAEHGPSDVGFSGPGHHVAVLETGDRPDLDPAGRAVTVDQFEKDRDAVYELLASRWGDTDPYNLRTVQLRTEREDIPEPWGWLSHHAGVAWLWEVRGTGRWVAVALADRDPSGSVELLAVVTETAPP